MKTKTLQPILLFLMVMTAFSFTASTQTGYIYVHKKTYDESSSVDFTLTGTGGIGTITLNDIPTQIPVKDIGSSQNGRLWAVGTSNATLYYRDMGSSVWTATAITNASRVDGGSTNTCYVVLTTGSIISYNGAITTIGAAGDYGASNAADVGSTWDTRPYIINAAGAIWHYSGAGTAWAQVGATTNNISIDGNPLTNDVVVCKTDNIAYSVTAAGVATSLGNAANTNAVSDVAVDALGNIYACFNFSLPNSSLTVCKWSSGNAWNIENTSLGSTYITAGAGGEVWAVGIDGNTAPFGNIFTRSYNGTAVQWIDDERVRTSPVNGNSEMIAVVPGTYTITETEPSGWDNTGITIGDPTNNSTADTIGNTVTLNVAANETVNVIFINVKLNPFPMTTDCNVVYKEDFGTGTVGSFGPVLTGQTAYHFIADGSASAADGYYKVAGRGIDWAFYSDALSDHTSGNGTGRMMAVNASYEASQFFRRRFTGLVLGATYNFSAWIASLTNSFATIRPNVSFLVIDPNNFHTIASTTSGDITSVATWGQYNLSFTATTTTIDLSIVNNTVGGYGNDLALDDIVFALVPPDGAITTTHTNVTCATTGSITVTAPVGSSYQYSKDGVNYQVSPTFAGLAIGSYNIYYRYAAALNCINYTPVAIQVISTCPLPVTLVSFIATAQGSTVKLAWEVAAEINLLNYEVQYSDDGNSYTSIAVIPAINSSPYYAVHTSPVDGINYYRLKITDIDGRFVYSPVRIVNFGTGDQITIYPNPAKNEIRINMAPNRINKPATIQIITGDGKVAMNRSIDATSQTETIDISKLQSGIYNVKLTFADGKSVMETITVIK